MPPAPLIVWAGTLKGGVPVSVVERHGLPLVRVELSFDTTAVRTHLSRGSLDALGGTWGARAADPGDTSDTLQLLGADVSIGCGAVRCWTAFEVPVEGLPEALLLTSELVKRPRLARLSRWRRDARREWRTDWLGPRIVHARALGRLTWADGHPYRLDRARGAFGVGRADVQEAWRTVVEDSSASVIVVGDVRASDVLPLLSGAFGGLGRAIQPLPVAPPPPFIGRHVLVDAPGADQAIVSVTWPSPTLSDPDHDAYALAFRALAGGFASRLNLRLREQEGLTYRVDGAYFAESAYGWSHVELAMDPSRVATALAILENELERARSEGFTEVEINAARHGAWVEAAVEAATLAGVARTLWLDRRSSTDTSAIHDTSMNHLLRLRDVSVAQVAAAASERLSTPRTWLVSGDSAVLEPLLERAGWPTDTVWGACQAVYGGRCPR